MTANTCGLDDLDQLSDYQLIDRGKERDGQGEEKTEAPFHTASSRREYCADIPLQNGGQFRFHSDLPVEGVTEPQQR